jgi:hypothetical protein
MKWNRNWKEKIFPWKFLSTQQSKCWKKKSRNDGEKIYDKNCLPPPSSDENCRTTKQIKRIYDFFFADGKLYENWIVAIRRSFHKKKLWCFYENFP